jgi:nucleoid-associated protein YgaU
MAQATAYTVSSGDTLSSLASHFYGNDALWTIIYDANKQTIGENPDLLQVGQVLSIPTIPPTPGAYYHVESGDSLTSIAQRAYGDGSQWQAIYKVNEAEIGPDPNLLQSDQVLFIPLKQPGTTYTVRPGDSLSAIAERFYHNGNQWRKIYEANRETIGPDPNVIRPGTVLTIPS